MRIESFLFQITNAENRFNKSKQRRERRASALQQLRDGEMGDLSRIDDPRRIARRLMTQAQDFNAGEAIITASLIGSLDSHGIANSKLLERIIDGNDLLSSDFLTAGHKATRTVGRIVVRSSGGTVLGYGTGFLISPRLAMTNNHVLESAAVATRSSIQFDFVETLSGQQRTPAEFELAPTSFFVTDVGLDFTLVAVESSNSFCDRGWNHLIEESGKGIVGERVNLIQHPNGDRQQLALRKNEIVDVAGDFLHYVADTERGSSGSPVFNDQWQLAALHHAGVPEKIDGKIMQVNGEPWDGSKRNIDKIKWIANEGARISQIVQNLRNQQAKLPPSERRLLEQAFEPFVAEASESTWQSSHQPSFSDGKLSWQIPIDFSISVPFLSPPAVDRHLPTSAKNGQTDDRARLIEEFSKKNIARAKAAFKKHKDDAYFDATKDEADNIAYYADIADALVGDELFDALSKLVEATHTKKFDYDTARYDHLYPIVDLREDRALASIYSGQMVEFDEVVTNEALIQARHELEIQEFMLREGAFDEAAVADFRFLLESQDPFNCEHIVVQSWFHHQDPMKSDLHHLTTCEPGCNSSRNNNAYFEFSPDLSSFNQECGQVRANESKFEPVAGKGIVARATLYYLLRYPQSFDHEKAMTADRLPLILKWHHEEPVSLFERHRNAEIFRIQGNRNPLIDFPDWAEHIPFERGL